MGTWDREPRRWPWQDEFDGTLRPGWALTFVVGGITAIGLLVQWLNDMHMYGYGLFAR